MPQDDKEKVWVQQHNAVLIIILTRPGHKSIPIGKAVYVGTMGKVQVDNLIFPDLDHGCQFALKEWNRKVKECGNA